MAVPAELVFISKRKGQEVRIHQSDRPDDEICILFGRSPGRMEKVGGGEIESSHATPARLSVFDAPLIAGSITPQMRETLDDELTEVKSENAIDRITSQANPRTLETGAGRRAFPYPHGARCALRGGRGVAGPCSCRDCACSKTTPWAVVVRAAAAACSFGDLKLTWRGKDYYAAGAAEREIASGADVAGLQAKVQEIGDVA